MNKEQFRKELEDATEWGFNHNWINFKTWASDRDTYITTRLAAIDDGNENGKVPELPAITVDTIFQFYDHYGSNEKI